MIGAMESQLIRRTKIVSTLGPATDDPQVLERLIVEGINVARLNFSHGCADDHRRRAQLVRQISTKLGRTVAILGDLQGPKIRIAQFKDGSVTLAPGDAFTLDASLSKSDGDQAGVGIDYEHLPTEVGSKDRLLLDDGRVVLEVVEVVGEKICTQVVVGGVLSNNKGINRQGGGLSASALTEKDYNDIRLAADIDVDYLAISFVRSADDINQARSLLQQAGAEAGIVAKIERAEAVMDKQQLDGIIQASDCIMVARGDLGVEIGDAELMAVQKYLIERSREKNKAVITATQMMESMITNPLPTRAEVFDVANAVLDGTDAVMLSAETATGGHPAESVAAMHRIILGAERYRQTQVSDHRLHQDFTEIDESIAMAVMYTANHLRGVTAIISLTETGNTPLLMSRISSGFPVFAFTRNQRTEQRVALYRGVVPVTFDISGIVPDALNSALVEELVRRNVVAIGDLVIISTGDVVNVHGGTNTMKIVKVGESVY